MHFDNWSFSNAFLCQSSSTGNQSSTLPLGAPSMAITLLLLLLSLCARTAVSQPRTDPSEVKALNTILGRWGKTAGGKWNISGEPCSGWAVDDTDIDNNWSFNPGIKCDCSYNNKTVCHIYKLRVYALEVVGTIPEELQSFKFLRNLDIRQNYLTGSLPAFFGNFTDMQYLTVGTNALSGAVPSELGKLQNLISLSISSNNFSGSIPEEFGNLTKLQQLYVAYNHLSGELPATLSRLTALKTVWASGNAFTGQIPEYIGSWKNLTDLRIQGNSFQGPIPSSLSNLVQLSNLRIGEIVNGSSSSLDFISNMTSLSILILRNCRISDVIPSSIANFGKLQHLDLSFNNITGNLPQFLFTLSSLQFLFLGNNSISGNLVVQKSSSLLAIDLSYNQLSGNLPSWVNDNGLHLNLVANNFNIDNSLGSTYLKQLKCLQRDTPCNRNAPRYASFAIKCGSNKTVKASDGTTFDADNADLQAASSYVTDPPKWAVSSVGRFLDASAYTYIATNSTRTSNTLDTELFQSARLSPSSLRYYGIGLQNGNYTVELQFAEINILDPPLWESLGRRIFDIYIQGELKVKDFDVRKAAGGHSFYAVNMSFIVPVTTNFLEIHLFWAGKGTCCIPLQGTYGPTISAISATPQDFTPNLPVDAQSNVGLTVGIVVGVAALGMISAGLFVYIQRRRKQALEQKEIMSIVGRPDIFSLAEMKAATENFSTQNFIGKGGYGSVYKGRLQDGRIVAIKQLSETSTQGKRQFIAEISTISAVRHRNLVRLLGCCIEGKMKMLVYEFLENQSLDKALFGKNAMMLDWQQRFNLCMGIATGLAYIHGESNPMILHRDIKSSNILLDSHLNPKISDFGLAKLYDHKKTHVSTNAAGTHGYMAPEYAMRGHLSDKVDVFAFGVVMLEIVSGRPAQDETQEYHNSYLLGMAWTMHLEGRTLEIVDPRLMIFDSEEATRVICTALQCTQGSPRQRPTMAAVLSMLRGTMEPSNITTMPSYVTEFQINHAATSSAATEYPKGEEAHVLNPTYTQLSSIPLSEGR